MSGGGDPELPDETASERALAEVAAENFARYQEVFMPLENSYIDSVMNVTDQGAYESAGGRASTAFAEQFDPAMQDYNSQLMASGMDPSSMGFQSRSNALRKAAAVGQGLGVADAQIGNTDRFYGGLSSIVNMGQGLQTESMAGMGDLAKMSQEKAAAQAEAAFNRASTGRETIGTIAGGASAYGLRRDA
jgi:hypothetical protein